MTNYEKQMFATEANTTVAADVEPAISIDHNERLVAGIQSLQTVLGIADMTPMAAGTTVNVYKYTKVNTPEQVGEGEVVPLTEYKRQLAKTITLTLNKYRKLTTAEAIQKSGRAVAINKTDDLMMKDVQKDVKGTFYAALAAAQGDAGKAAGLQAALAAVWGKVATYFEDMDVEPIYFVNPLDIADYLKTAQVSLQTAFGFKYIEDFLGLGTVVVDAKVTEGTVSGTAKENLNGIYIPADGDVAETFGLTFDASGMVGMTHSLAADRFSIQTLIASGVNFYPEDATGIFKATIEAAA